ncbi:hypothetical protein GIB67_004917 [Kingdonia uniflora]|uniref:Uncharacterized protein n=1 Tax=Kingdonia uniflora TaxID=39325 RepID=A0A7J7LNN7_9MAGN|nr:hypothetical protein GIB67_004917 [Kingdonia uniflora]
MRSQLVHQAADGRLHIKVAGLRERYFCRLPYDAILPEWPLNLIGLDDEGRSSMRSKPRIPMSKSVVSSSSEEISSWGRKDKCNAMEETVNSIKGEWGRYLVDQGRWFRANVPGKGEEAVYYQVSCLEKWKKERGTSVDVNLSYYNSLRLAGPSRPWNNHLLWVGGNCMQVPDEPTLILNYKYYNLKPNPSSGTDNISLFNCVAHDQVELKQHSILLKGVIKYFDKRSQEFGDLTLKFDTQSTRIKELEADLELEKKKRSADAEKMTVTDVKLAQSGSEGHENCIFLDKKRANRETRQRLHKAHMQLKEHLYPSRAKIVARTEHEHNIESVIDFYGEELARVDNEFRKFVAEYGKDFDIENAKAKNMWFTKDEEEIIGEKPNPKLRKLSPEEDEEEVELVAAQSQCDALCGRNEQLNAEVNSCQEALKSTTELKEKTKVTISKEQKTVVCLTDKLQKKEVELARELKRINELTEVIRKKDVKILGTSEQTNQQEAELTSAQTQITELLAVWKRARNKQNENINKAWNRVSTLEYTIQLLGLDILEYQSENGKLRDANTKLDADLCKVEISLDKSKVNRNYREDKVEGSMFMVCHMNEFMIVLEAQNADAWNEKRTVDKRCQHLEAMLKEAQDKLSELILSKKVKSESGDVYERDMTTLISFFVSEFNLFEAESRTAYDSLVSKASIYVQASFNQCSILESQGLKLSKLLMVLLQPYVEEVLEMNFRRPRSMLLNFEGNDDILPPQIASAPPSLTTSSSNSMHADSGTRFIFLVNDTIQQLTPKVISYFGVTVLTKISHFFDEYVEILIKALPGPSEDLDEFSVLVRHLDESDGIRVGIGSLCCCGDDENHEMTR